MLIKEKIRFDGQSKNIKLPISANFQLGGLSESIEDFIEEELGLSINPADDLEKFRYLLEPTSVQYEFKFYNGSTHSDTLTNAGFTTGEINDNDSKVLSSFYIIQIYDNTNVNNQTLLHSGYFNGFDFSANGSSSDYTLDNDDEFTSLYLPQNFIETITGGTTFVYARFFFYSAKTGQLKVFLNEDNEGRSDLEKFLFRVRVDVDAKTYTYVLSTSEAVNTTLDIKETTNTEYTNKINDTLESQNNETPNPTQGVEFQSDGNYQ
jgi:hypothetical protein